MKDMKCLRCNGEMQYVGNLNLQTTVPGGILPGLFGGLRGNYMEVHVYSCPDCGKIEFFNAESCGEAALADKESAGNGRVCCSFCGTLYSAERETCPRCGNRTLNEEEYPQKGGVTCPYCGTLYYGGGPCPECGRGVAR